MLSSSRQVVRTSDGTLYAVINDGGSCEVWSSSDGSSWAEQDAADNPACNTSTGTRIVAVAVDSSNTLHFVYNDDASFTDINYIPFTTSDNQFGTEATAIIQHSATASYVDIDIAVDSNDKPHVVITNDQTGTDTVRYTNKVSGSWKAAVTVDSVSGGFRGPSIAISEDNIPEISHINSTDLDLTAAVGNVNDAASFTLQDVDANVLSGLVTSIGIDSSGNTWIGYVDENGATDFVTLVKHNDADAWTTWQAPVTNSNAGDEPSIAINGTDVYVFYDDENADVKYDKYTGSWLGETNLQTGTFQDVKAKWSYYNNNQGGSQIDYLYSDNTDVYWASLGLSTATGTPSIKTEDLCLAGGCLSFDGSDDDVVVTNASSIDLDAQLAGAFTAQAWIRPNGAGEGTGGQIFYKGTNTWLRVDTLSSGKLDIEASLDLATTDATLNVTSPVDDNRWNHVVLSYTDDGDDEITIYVNGNNVGSSTNGVGAPAADTNNILIGGNTTNNFKGFIDEFKIYKEERTAAQIKTDFVKGTSSLHGVQAAYGIRDYSFLSDGLVGYWKMDETSWTNDCATDTVLDSSGNSNNGDSCPNTTGPTGGAAGKFGKGGDFDGGNDYVQVPDNSTLDITGTLTLSAWVNADTLASTQNVGVVGKYRSQSGQLDQRAYLLYLNENTDKVGFVISPDGTTTPSAKVIESNATISTAAWYHLVTVYEPSRSMKIYINGTLDKEDTDSVPSSTYNSPAPLWLGLQFDTTNSELYLDGKLDDVRIYNRAFTPLDVQKLYLTGPGPVGYWPMDENTGTTTVNDRSGNGNTGTMNGSMTESDWVPGKFGSALDFDGSDDKVTISDSSSLDTNSSFTIESWVNFSVSQNSYILEKGTTGTANYYLIYYSSGPSRLRCGFFGGAVFRDHDFNWTPTLSRWYYIACAFDDSGNTVKVYVDGVELGSTAQTNSPDTNANELWLGRSSVNNSDTINGKLDDVRIYNYARTSSQIIEDMNAGHPAPGSPVGSALGHWKFDEGYGDTANDSGTGANNGNLAGSGGSCPGAAACPSWTNSGKFGKALNFDGTDDFISVTDTSALDMGTNAFSVSAWVNASNLGAASREINLFSKTSNYFSSPGWVLELSTYGGSATTYGFAFAITNSANFDDNNVNSRQGAYSTGQWYHVVATRDGTTQRIYVNGTLDGTDTHAAVDDTVDNSVDIQIGGKLGWQNIYFPGSIDGVKIYNFALTADQVKVDMNLSSAASFGNVADQNNEGFGGNPPIGWWKMDENTGTGSNAVKDTSGNNNHGTTNGSMTESDWVPGKFGSALDFDGANDYVNVSSTANCGIDWTVSAWIKTSITATHEITARSKSGEAEAENYNCELGILSDGKVSSVYEYGAGNNVQRDGTATVTDGNWHHVVASRNDANGTLYVYVDGVRQDGTLTGSPTNDPSGGTSSTQCIGGSNCEGPTFFMNGLIDEVKIFNYARTQAQVVYDFNRGQPLGYWKLDECSGSTANDSGFGANNGTITIGASGTNTSNGTCGGAAGQGWFDGKTGKRNASLEFDGNDDRVDMGNPTDLQLERTIPMTLEAWFKTTTDGNMTIFSKQDSSAPFSGYNLQTGSGDFLYLQLVNTYGTNMIQVNNTTPVDYNNGAWHHVAATYDGSSTAAGVKLYFDGANLPLSTSDSLTASILNSINFYVGSRNNAAQFFNGQIDEVKIYNYALTADQVKKSYNNGAVFFGPATGSP